MYLSQFPIFQRALGSDKKVPAASKVEQDRLREAIRNKEEERKRKRREMKEEAEKKRETKQEASTPTTTGTPIIHLLDLKISYKLLMPVFLLALPFKTDLWVVSMHVRWSS